MSITDLKRHSQRKTPTISRLIGPASELAVDVKAAAQPDAHPHAARSPGLADGVHPDAGAKTDRSIGQPGFHAGREMTLVTHGRRRRRQVRINGADDLGAVWRTGPDRGTRPHLTRQLNPACRRPRTPAFSGS